MILNHFDVCYDLENLLKAANTDLNNKKTEYVC